MNIKVAVLGMMVASVAGSAMAQENDDMYFNSKDRTKLNEKVAAQKKTEALAYNDRDEEATTSPEDDNINTTDYSARNLNPEYVSRSNSELAQEDDENYFVNDYRFANLNNLNQFNHNYNNWYNNDRWYNTSYYPNYNSGFNSSPYYYNSFASPWCSLRYQSGFYGGLSFYSGSPYYGSSWGGGYNGWGYDPWSSSYAYGGGYGGYYGGGYGGYYGGGYGGYYGGGNNVIIINEGSGRGQVYGKRPARGGMVYHPSNSTPNRRSEVGSRGNGASGGRVSTATNTGRVSTATNTGRTQTQDDYYNRSWRSNRTTTPSNSNSSWSNGSGNSGRSNSGWSNGNSSTTPTRSSDNGGNSRSWGGNSGSSSHSSSGSSSGSSGGRTRGRD